MSILIGIKQTQTSGSFHGAEGFKSISMDGTKFHILRDGTHDELYHYVEEIREKARQAKEDLTILEIKMEMSEMSNSEYVKCDKKYNELLKVIQMAQYDKFVIFEGRTV